MLLPRHIHKMLVRGNRERERERERAREVEGLEHHHEIFA